MIVEVFIIVASVGVVIAAVTVDAVTGHLQDRPPAQIREKSKQASNNDTAEMKQGIAAYRNMKRIELGLLKTCERNRREAQHKRLQAS